jgi:hypothetical protein
MELAISVHDEDVVISNGVLDLRGEWDSTLWEAGPLLREFDAIVLAQPRYTPGTHDCYTAPQRPQDPHS